MVVRTDSGQDVALLSGNDRHRRGKAWKVARCGVVQGGGLRHALCTYELHSAHRHRLPP